jgi:hypothetical protein
MGEYEYLPYIALWIIGVYLLLIALMLFLYPIKDRDYFAHVPRPLLQSFTKGYFEEWSTRALFATRVIFALFFLVYFIVLVSTHYHRGLWIFYTNWNVLLLIVFYAGATSLSCISMRPPSDSPPSFREFAAGVLLILYLVAAPSAFFVTLVDLSLLNPNPTYWNYSAHLVTSISILSELFLNSIEVTPRDLCFPLTWALLYTIFVWIMRAEGVAKIWPYDFLSTSSSSSFVWYTVLYLLVIICFFLFFGLGLLKRRYLRPHPIQSAACPLPGTQ